MVRNLVEALLLMAAPASEQMAALPDWIAMPDEIALLFDDAFVVLEPGDLPAGRWPQIEAIATRLATLEEKPRESVWTLDALVRSTEWEDLRIAAQEALSALGVSPRAPQIDPGNYVPAPGLPNDLG